MKAWLLKAFGYLIGAVLFVTVALTCSGYPGATR
jgi:hypothetical protein